MYYALTAQKGSDHNLGITIADKSLSTDRIDNGGRFNIKFTITAEPALDTNPADIVLLLDRSQSMAGSPLANIKNGAKRLAEIIGSASNADNVSRTAVISFADEATDDTQLTDDTAQINDAINALTAGGSSDYRKAFQAALDMLDFTSPNNKYIVMFTDGTGMTGGDAAEIADICKAKGIIIYIIGVAGSSGINKDNLYKWASLPAAAYVVITPENTETESLFDDLETNINKPGAKDIVITDILANEFNVVSVFQPSTGSAALINSTTVEWKIESLGVCKSEAAVLEFEAVHIGPETGLMNTNASAEFSDTNLNAVTFPSPEIFVDTDSIIIADGCPDPVDIEVNGCEDSVEFYAGDVPLSSGGRIIQLDVTLRNVCPVRRTALAAIVSEVCGETELGRAMRTIVIPAQGGDTCRDITVRCINFVLPDETDCRTELPCEERHFRARFIANYIDTGFNICCTDDDGGETPAKRK